MKNTFKIAMLFCLTVCMLFSTVACRIVITPIETDTTNEVTGEATTPQGTTPEATTPEGTTPEETTSPEETTPEETTPEETTTPDPNEGKVIYKIKVTDTSGRPIAGVELQLSFGETYINLPPTQADGCAFSEYLVPQDYAVRILRADGYDFNTYENYYFMPSFQKMDIALEPLPEKIDMQGYTYKAYVRDNAGAEPDAYHAQIQNGNNDYRCIDFWVDEANSENDVISYSVYNRNKQIETDYNCKIRQVASDGSQIEYLIAALQNGDGYDLTIMTAKPAAQAATYNLLQNLKASQYMDLSNPSFDQNSVKELSVKDKLYFVSGDMNISTMEVAGATIVNMDFYEDLADSIVCDLYDNDPLYSNIYNIVSAKKWTMETMLKIAMLANVDIDPTDGALHVLPNGVVNGMEVDNKYKGGDTVGYHQYLYSTLWYFYGSGGRITAQNEDGLPEFVIDQEKGQTLYTYIFDKFNRQINAPWIPHESSSILNKNFLTGQVLFADTSLFNIRTEIYNWAEFEYGILPLPVYEEGMDYQSVAYFNNWAHLWAIPQMAQNDEYAERMMQIMAVYSGLEGSTMDAYYERTIYLAASKDNGSREVMDTIKSSLVYDMALLYSSWGSFEQELYSIANADAGEYTDIIESLWRVEANLQMTIDQLINPTGE